MHVRRVVMTCLPAAALLLAACTAAPPSVPPPSASGSATASAAPLVTPLERMPPPASIWLTAEPAAPAWPVDVALTSLDDPAVHRAHVFAGGVTLRGSVPLSSGRYRLTAMGGACAIDLDLGPDREKDVAIRVAGPSACSMTVVREHGDGVDHPETSELVAP